ncbi:unnamed protein product [Protopolystoma xenopodis]|uniref:Uncharacterized protein n=1 Tax=Protopolystoma xenopodis TaxID=117903 RepID=A0A3S5FE71_9PLAT|nr:unnamed protein product [Protopolystoma xenopodis]
MFESNNQLASSPSDSIAPSRLKPSQRLSNTSTQSVGIGRRGKTKIHPSTDLQLNWNLLMQGLLRWYQT